MTTVETTTNQETIARLATQAGPGIVGIAGRGRGGSGVVVGAGTRLDARPQPAPGRGHARLRRRTSRVRASARSRSRPRCRVDRGRDRREPNRALVAGHGCARDRRPRVRARRPAGSWVACDERSRHELSALVAGAARPPGRGPHRAHGAAAAWIGRRCAPGRSWWPARGERAPRRRRVDPRAARDEHPLADRGPRRPAVRPRGAGLALRSCLRAPRGGCAGQLGCPTAMASSCVACSTARQRRARAWSVATSSSPSTAGRWSRSTRSSARSTRRRSASHSR